MTVIVNSPEDVCNLALDRIGYPTSIASIYEGSAASRVALRQYAQTRDGLLKAWDWQFAERFVAAVDAGQTPPPPWLYEFEYPSDCLRVRYVMPAAPGSYPVNDPYPVLFSEFNDTRISPPTKTVLTNISPATIVYTGQVSIPSEWDAGFVDALAEALARRFAVALTRSADLEKMEAVLSDAATGEALGAQVNLPPMPTSIPAVKR
jgi:hypothetical protein